MKTWLAVLILIPGSAALAGDEAKPPAKKAVAPAVPVSPERELEALAFVREHHPELAAVVTTLKTRSASEYQKAIGELAQVAGSLEAVRERNPARYPVLLDAWKAKSRVELIAAQLASNPSPERESELRQALEIKVDTEIARLRFDREQAEAVARKARLEIERLEKNRAAVIENRLRMLQPRPKPKPKSQVVRRPAAGPTTPATTPANATTPAPAPAPAPPSNPNPGSAPVPGGKDR
jgi:hypothetical protein